MKLGYTIVYVPDVEASLAFCEKAFGLPAAPVQKPWGQTVSYVRCPDVLVELCTPVAG